MKITDWAKVLGLQIEVATSAVGWSASVKRCEVKRDGMLGAVVGFGATPDGALADCAAKISGKRVAVDAYTPQRREYDVPELEWS